jgi:hypothetical protein
MADKALAEVDGEVVDLIEELSIPEKKPRKKARSESLSQKARGKARKKAGRCC